MGQAVPYTADQLEPQFQKCLYKGGCDGICLQPDPIGDVNLYPYVTNNPVNYTDPNGEIGIMGGALIIVSVINTELYLIDTYETNKMINALENEARATRNLINTLQGIDDECPGKYTDRIIKLLQRLEKINWQIAYLKTKTFSRTYNQVVNKVGKIILGR